MMINSELSIDTIRGLLCGALEGGSNHWYEIRTRGCDPPHDLKDFSHGGKAQDPDNYWHWSQLIPTTEGGWLEITAPGAGEPYEAPRRLDLQALKIGAQVMASKYPRHFSNILTEDDDAETGDVFLQCCLYGEVVFG